MKNDAALERLATWPRTGLVREPTPLVAATRLSSALGLDRFLLVKMDGETGLAFGGNKLRKLEFELAHERMEGVTHIVTTGGIQSNHCRLTAAATLRLGRECVLVLNGEPPADPTGNARLHRLLGARLHHVASPEERDPEMARIADEIRAGGGRALVIPLGASTPLGSLGYARAAVEFDRQCPSDGRPVRVFVSASSCGTYAGLLLGFALLGRRDVTVVGVSPDVTADEIREVTSGIVHGAAGLLGLEEPPPMRIVASEAFVGDGYGIPSSESEEAAERFAATEALLLDRWYTAKVGAAVLAAARNPSRDPGERLVFWHTGGTPSVLA